MTSNHAFTVRVGTDMRFESIHAYFLSLPDNFDFSSFLQVTRSDRMTRSLRHRAPHTPSPRKVTLGPAGSTVAPTSPRGRHDIAFRIALTWCHE